MFIPTAVLLLAGLILGGATSYGYLSEVILQLIAIPVLLAAIWKMIGSTRHGQAKWVIFFCLILVLVPLLQLIPLPPDIWTILPGREELASAMRLTSDDLPWMPLSLSPRSTWLGVLALLPFLAVFLSVQQLGYCDRRRLSGLIIIFAIFSVFLGLLQVAQGPSSSLRFYDYVHLQDAIGFFASRNHFAALLYSTIVLVVAWLLAKTAEPQKQFASGGFDKVRMLYMLLGFVLIAALIAAQLTARSRAGLGLTIVAFIGIYFMSQIGRVKAPKSGSVKLLGAIIVLMMIFSAQFALFRIMERMDAGMLSAGTRTIFAGLTIVAAKANMPFGTGMGSFVPTFKHYETTQTSAHAYFANHAHNDYLQVWLEAGIVGLLVMALFMLWVLYRSYNIWRYPRLGGQEIDNLLARAATIIIVLLALHSIVDYPLRTTAMMVVMAFISALLVDPPAHTLERQDVEEFKDEPFKKKIQTKPVTAFVPRPAAAPIRPTAQSPNLSSDKTPWEGVEWPKEWQKKDD